MKARSNFLVRDPDERIVRWGWVLWIAWLAVGGALLRGDYRAGVIGIGAVLAAPFWALWLLWALYRGVRVVIRASRLWALAEHGEHYEFDGRRIRIEFDGDAIRFAAADVFEALHTSDDSRDPARVRQIAGRDGLAASPGSGELVFSEKGLAAWLDRRTDRNALQFARWIDRQVIAPYRRRREIEDSSGAAP